MTIEAPQLSPGTVIDGFTIGSSVRSRSGAVTYEATDANGAKVHFTAYAGGCFATPLVRERSLRELKQLQGVNVPQVTKVHACGKIDAEAIYEVTDPVEGETVANMGAQSKAEAAKIAGAVGDALLAAQKVGVIHRNLGPTTVVVNGGAVQVFGFTVGEPQGGEAFGPLDTIAPEQAEGKVVDQRSLIYNLAALAHQIVAGKPLFDGAPADKLAAHLNTDPPADVDPKLARALSKDPKARPMMLKQFVTDVKGLAGADGGAPAKPSKRGWTMFMDAADGGGAPAPAPAPAPTPAAAPSPTPAPAPASAASPTPAPSAPAGGEAKPSKRGWTMFMDAEDGGSPAPAPVAAPAPSTPAPSAPAPSAPSPAAAATPSPAPSTPKPAEAKPSKRGWTMFMDAEDGGSPAPAAAAPSPSPAPSAPAPSAPTPSSPKPAAASPVPAPAPSAPAGEKKPSTRGWTMFMDAADGGDAPAAGSSPSPAPTTPAAPSPSPSPSSATPAGPAASPSAPASADGASPSTRGWTMFMDGNEGGGEAKPDAATRPDQPAVTAPPSPEPAQPAAATPGGPDGGKAPSTRGWTMFMEAPLPAKEADAPAATPAAAAPAPQPAAEEQKPAVDGASDAKGWTVFMDQSPFAGQTPGAPGPEAASGPMGFKEPAGQAGADPRQAAAEAAAASAPRPGQGKTIVAGGLKAPTAPAGGSDGQPDTMYFKRGSAEPERVGAPRDDAPVPAAASAPAQETGAAGGSDPQPQPVPAGASPSPAPQPQSMAPMGRNAPVAAQSGGGGGKVAMIVGGIVVIIVIIVVAVFVF